MLLIVKAPMGAGAVPTLASRAMVPAFPAERLILPDPFIVLEKLINWLAAEVSKKEEPDRVTGPAKVMGCPAVIEPARTTGLFGET